MNGIPNLPSIFFPNDWSCLEMDISVSTHMVGQRLWRGFESSSQKVHVCPRSDWPMSQHNYYRIHKTRGRTRQFIQLILEGATNGVAHGSSASWKLRSIWPFKAMDLVSGFVIHLLLNSCTGQAITCVLFPYGYIYIYIWMLPVKMRRITRGCESSSSKSLSVRHFPTFGAGQTLKFVGWTRVVTLVLVPKLWKTIV